MKLPRLSGQEVIKILSKSGFKPVRQKGSHVLLIKHIGGEKIGTVVPLHKELKTGTLRGILRQARITPTEFIELIKRS